MNRALDLPTLACGRSLDPLVAQVADGAEPRDPGHQGACPHCRDALAQLRELWSLAGRLARERVVAPERIDAVVLGRIQRAILAGKVLELFGGLLPRLGWALLTYGGLVERGVAR
jgi:hypothetical protein